MLLNDVRQILPPLTLVAIATKLKTNRKQLLKYKIYIYKVVGKLLRN